MQRICGLPMEGHDHSDCAVELRPCPNHKADHEARMLEAMSHEGSVHEMTVDKLHGAVPHCQCGCSEIDAAEVVGWCFHCTHVYAKYSPQIQDRHLAYDCPGAPSELKQTALASLAKRAEKRGQ